MENMLARRASELRIAQKKGCAGPFVLPHSRTGHSVRYTVASELEGHGNVKKSVEIGRRSGGTNRLILLLLISLIATACGAVEDLADAALEQSSADDPTEAVAFSDDTVVGAEEATESVADAESVDPEFDDELEAPAAVEIAGPDVAAAGPSSTAPATAPEPSTSPTETVTPTTAAPTTDAPTTVAPTTAAPVTAAPPITPPSGPPSWPDVETPNITGPEYVLQLGRWGIPNNGTAPIGTRANFQAALDWAHDEGYGTVKVPAGTYLIGEVGNDIYFDGIHLHDNMALVLDDRAEIVMATNDKWNYCAVTIGNASNAAVIGGTITGDRFSHIYTPRNDGATAHDEGHLICVQSGASNVLIDGVHLRHANGDGILLVGNNSQGEVHDITIRNSEMDTNRRQGISIVGAQQVLIENNEIHHTNGTSPQFGIDIESLSFDSRDIIIRGNHFHSNRGGDIVNTDGKNVLVEDNLLRQGGDNRYIDGPLVSWPRGDWTVRNNTINMLNGSVNGKSGFIGYASSSGTDFEAETSYFIGNTCNGCGMYVYNSANIEVRDNTFIEGYIVMQNWNNAVIVNNDVTYENSRCWAYRFRQVTGQASGNTYNGEPFEIPLSDTPWDGCWVN